MTSDEEHAAKTWDSVRATARTRPAFSNGFEWESWAITHCWTCVRDAALDGGCVIAGLAITDQVTPLEWKERNPFGLSDRYTCTDFKPLSSSTNGEGA